MKSYIKLYGPPIMEALKALRKVALDVPEVCVMDNAIAASLGFGSAAGAPVGIGGGQREEEIVMHYFGDSDELSEDRCNTIISKSGESVGEYDFYYEWFTKPTISQIEDLVTKIDNALVPTGVRYSITTR